jgi:hypothetical protein
MLKTDLYASRMDDRTQLAAVSGALADGAATAKDLRRRFPGLTPREIADELRVPIVTTDDDPLVGAIWRYAEYRPRPPQIVLYIRGLAVERVLARALGTRLLGDSVVQDVFVAHVLYHHAETIRAEMPIARRYQATIFQIGKWRRRTGITTLAEIATFFAGLARPALPSQGAGLRSLRRHWDRHKTPVGPRTDFDVKSVSYRLDLTDKFSLLCL